MLASRRLSRRHRAAIVLLPLLLAALVLTRPAGAAAASDPPTHDCPVALVAGRCPVVSGATDPGGVTLTATAPPRPGAPARTAPPRQPPGPAPASPQPRVTISLPAPLSPPPPHRLAIDAVCESAVVACGSPRPASRAPQAPTRAAPALPVPTLVDVAHVVGSASVARMQPDGWAVIGLPAVFLADGRTRTRTAALLGRPAAVRFVPTAFHWTFGDGARLDTATAGDPWPATGRAGFTAGPTSHVFAVAGALTVQLVTDYRAEYRYGRGSWVALPGTLSLAAEPLPVTVLRATTLLVARDCVEKPAGPGCSPR